MGTADEFKVESEGSRFLKGKDFDAGLQLTVVRMEKFTPEDPQYGVKNTYGPGGVVTKENWFVKKGILAEGQSFRYVFEVNGAEKTFDNNSISFYMAYTKVNPEPTNDVYIKRTMKSQTEVSWEVKIVD